MTKLRVIVANDNAMVGNTEVCQLAHDGQAY